MPCGICCQTVYTSELQHRLLRHARLPQLLPREHCATDNLRCLLLVGRRLPKGHPVHLGVAGAGGHGGLGCKAAPAGTGGRGVGSRGPLFLGRRGSGLLRLRGGERVKLPFADRGARRSGRTGALGRLRWCRVPSGGAGAGICHWGLCVQHNRTIRGGSRLSAQAAKAATNDALQTQTGIDWRGHKRTLLEASSG